MNTICMLIDSSYKQRKREYKGGKKSFTEEYIKGVEAYVQVSFDISIIVILYQFDFMTTVQIFVSFIESFISKYII